jgi:hypothetical protein
MIDSVELFRRKSAKSVRAYQDAHARGDLQPITGKMPRLFGTRFAIRDGIIVSSRSGS